MDGDRSPMDSAAGSPIERAVVASTGSRSAAIDAAFADFPDFNDDVVPSAVAPRRAEDPSGDDQADSTSATIPPAPKKATQPEVPESERPVEGQPVLPKSQDALEAPKHWPADRRQQFQTLPDDAKRIILERNKEANVAVTKAQQEAAQYRKTSEAVATVFNDDHRQQMANAGLDEVGAMRYLVQQHDALNRDPVGFLKAVIAQTGVKAEQLFGGQPAPQQPQGQPQPAPESTDEWVDPAVLDLKQQIAKLQEAETRRQQEIERHSRDQQTRFNQWFTSECNAFENAIDDEGHPKYPHLSAVMGNVVRLVQSDPALRTLLTSKPQEALENAYNQALYLDPTIRQQLIDADFERRQSALDAANSVKKAQAAATRKGSPGANGTARPDVKMSREDAITKAMRDLGL